MKYPDDFKGWKELGKMRGPLGGNYLVLESPDGSKLAQIHVEDNDVALVFERRTYRVLHMHPTSVKGLKALLDQLKTGGDRGVEMS